MTKISVGEEWSLTPIPDREGVIFELLDKDFPVLLFFYDGPTAKELQGLQNGKIKMGYYCRGSVLFLIFHIDGAGGWMDAPLSIRRYERPPEDFGLNEEYAPDQGLPFYFFLIDRNTKNVEAMRFITASHRFSVGFRTELHKQYSQPYSNSLYYAEIDSVYRNIPIKELVKRAENMFTAGER